MCTSEYIQCSKPSVNSMNDVSPNVIHLVGRKDSFTVIHYCCLPSWAFADILEVVVHSVLSLSFNTQFSSRTCCVIKV